MLTCASCGVVIEHNGARSDAELTDVNTKDDRRVVGPKLEDYTPLHTTPTHTHTHTHTHTYTSRCLTAFT